MTHDLANWLKKFFRVFGFSLDSLFGKDKTGSVDNSQPWEHYSLISKFFISDLRKKRMKKNVVSNENGFLSVAVKKKTSNVTSVHCLQSAFYLHTGKGREILCWLEQREK